MMATRAPLSLSVATMVWLAAMLAMPASAQTALTVDGTEFVLSLPAGRTLRSADLVGATLTIAAGSAPVEITIKRVEDDSDAIGGRVVLHHFVVIDATGRQADLCTPDATGRSLGFPVPDGRGGFDLACTSGAVAKCIRWGYRPWDEQPLGPPLKALHRACIHMTRADYGGDDHPTAREGTLVHVCDRFGVRPCLKDVPLVFEAAWGANGATCVARPRIADNMSLEELGERYPALRPHLGPAACSQESAPQNPDALLFNRSPQ